jgi:hypothetical protein
MAGLGSAEWLAMGVAAVFTLLAGYLAGGVSAIGRKSLNMLQKLIISNHFKVLPIWFKGLPCS